MSEVIVDYALKYQELGFFVLPLVPKTKQPYVKWAYRKNKRPTADEIKSWWAQHPNANVGDRGQLPCVRWNCPGEGTEKPRTMVRFKLVDIQEFIENHSSAT